MCKESQLSETVPESFVADYSSFSQPGSGMQYRYQSMYFGARDTNLGPINIFVIIYRKPGFELGRIAQLVRASGC